MQVVLVMFRGDGERRSFSITRDVTVVGRREDCDFRIPLGEISRKHCRLIKDGAALRVEDLGSSNGTFHNGERVQKAELAPGDTLQMGAVAFVVQIDGTPVDDALAPVTAGSRRTKAPSEAAVDGATVADDSRGPSNGGHSNGNGHSNGDGSGDFDPMTVLEAGNSGALPAMDDSNLSEDIMIDLSSSSSGDSSADHA